MKPVQIEAGEWWYKGCFIQEQEHPGLLKYHIFEDTEEQLTIDTTDSFKEAKRICEQNEVINYKNGYKVFL